MHRVTGAIVLVFCVCVLLVAGCASSAAGTSAKGSSQPRTLYPVSVDGKWGYIDKTGSLVIKPQFNSAADFSEGLAEVSENGVKFGYIDTSGTMVIQPQFYDTDAFSGGLAAVEIAEAAEPKDVRWGFIDKTGRLVIPAQFTAVWKFSEGLCWVDIQKDGQKDTTGFIDKTGNWVIKPDKNQQYVGAADFSEGVTLAGFNSYSAVIDQKGKVIAHLPSVPGGMWAAANDVSSSGPRGAASPSGFSEGLAPVDEVAAGNLLYGFVDKTGRVVIRPQFNSVGGFTEGLARAGIGSISYGGPA